MAAGAQDALLRARHTLRRQLHTEVAARHHDGVAEADDFIEIVEGLRLFQLGEHPGAALDDFLRLKYVFRTLHERQADIFNAARQGEIHVLAVLLGQGGDGQDDIGDIDALAVAQSAAIDDDRFQMVLAHMGDAQFQLAVIEQQVRTDLGGGDDFRVGQVGAARIAWRRIEVQAEILTVGQHHGAAHEAADAQFRSLDIGQDTDRVLRPGFQIADQVDIAAVVFVAAVRKVEPENIGAGLEKLRQHFGVGTRRPQGGDDLGFTTAKDFQFTSHGLKANPGFSAGLPGAASMAFFRVRQSLYSPAGSSLILCCAARCDSAV